MTTPPLLDAAALAAPVVRWLQPDYGTRYGKSRLGPKLPRKVKKAFKRKWGWPVYAATFEIDLAALDLPAGAATKG